MFRFTPPADRTLKAPPGAREPTVPLSQRTQAIPLDLDDDDLMEEVEEAPHHELMLGCLVGSFLLATILLAVVALVGLS